MDGFWFDSKTIDFACPLIYHDIYIYLNILFIYIFTSFALELWPLNDFKVVESPNPQGKKDEKMEKVAPTILQVRKNEWPVSVSQIDSACDIYNSLQLM